MRKVTAMILLSSALAIAQGSRPATRKMSTPTVRTNAQAIKPSSAGVPVAPQPELPSIHTVEAFMKRYFGQDPSIKWKILDILPSEAPGVADVIVVIGDQPRATHLYVLPGAEYAIVGDVIPFGEDPFAANRRKLSVAQGSKRGSDKPEVVLVEFSDLQCPHCKAAQPVIDRLMTDYPNAQLVFQDFPLPMHPWAMKAAQFGRCVAQQNSEAFWRYLNQVLEIQSAIDEQTASDKLAETAAKAGADADKTAKCASLKSSATTVQRSVELGRSLGVNSTPTVFINGRKILGIREMPYESLKQIVDFEIQQKKVSGDSALPDQSVAPR